MAVSAYFFTIKSNIVTAYQLIILRMCKVKSEQKEINLESSRVSLIYHMELTQKAQTANSCTNKKSKSKYKSHKRNLGVESEAVGDLS